MAFGKSIELFLVHGTSGGIVTAELSNWNGKAIKIPRTEVQGCKRTDIQGVGVYFLLCQDDDGGFTVLSNSIISDHVTESFKTRCAGESLPC